jgi:uncharacterized protein
MSLAELSALNTQVLLGAFILSLLLGTILQKTHFCTMGALGDAVISGDLTRLRQWALALGVAMVGFAGLVYAGQIEVDKTLYASQRWLWLSALTGGLMFGFGMVLASGCGSKTLVRIGSGNLKSLVVMLVMGFAAFATLKGVTAVLRVATVDQFTLDFDHMASLPLLWSRATGMSISNSVLLCGIVLGMVLMVWALRERTFLTLENLIAGLGVGGIVVAVWWLSGHWGHVVEHPQTLEEVFVATNSGRIESLSFVAPMAYSLDWLMFYSDTSKVLTMGVVSVAGVTLGSAFQSIRARTFRWEGFGGTADLAKHLIGAVLMGVGGVAAMGCTFGQGLSGLSTLSLTSVVAVAAIALGAVAAFKYQIWHLEQAS